MQRNFFDLLPSKAIPTPPTHFTSTSGYVFFLFFILLNFVQTALFAVDYP